MQELICNCDVSSILSACIIPCYLYLDGYLDSCFGGWDFIYRSNGWVLHHFMFTYHSYMYSRDWSSTLLWVYLWRTCELLVFVIFGVSTLTVQHPNQLGTMIEHCGVFNQSHLSFSYHSHNDVAFTYPYRFGDANVKLFDHHHDAVLPEVMRNLSFINDHWPREPFPSALSDVLLKEFSFALLAIITAWFHVYLFATPRDKDSFRISSFFVKYHYYDGRSEKVEYYADNVRGLRQYIESEEVTLYDATTTTEEDHRWVYEKLGFVARNGLWPPSLWFGNTGDGFWNFRKMYWYHLIQMALLGTPSGILLGLFTPSIGNNAGLVLYFFFTTCLLAIFYNWNTSMTIYRNNSVYRCRELYIIWILTLWVTIGCYTITSINRFFRITMASGVLILVSLVYYGVSRLFKPEKRQKIK